VTAYRSRVWADGGRRFVKRDKGKVRHQPRIWPKAIKASRYKSWLKEGSGLGKVAPCRKNAGTKCRKPVHVRGGTGGLRNRLHIRYTKSIFRRKKKTPSFPSGIFRWDKEEKLFHRAKPLGRRRKRVKCLHFQSPKGKKSRYDLGRAHRIHRAAHMQETSGLNRIGKEKKSAQNKDFYCQQGKEGWSKKVGNSNENTKEATSLNS